MISQALRLFISLMIAQSCKVALDVYVVNVEATATCNVLEDNGVMTSTAIGEDVDFSSNGLMDCCSIHIMVGPSRVVR